jgi:hypothetical protein
MAGGGMRRVQCRISIALVVALTLAGCGQARPGGDTQLPDYAYRSAQALQGYRMAVVEQELLARLPCYCGCGKDRSYRNLRDCFISAQGVFNPHGANCLVCIEQVEDAVVWKEQGLGTREIRTRTDIKYQGRGTPTDTPPVEEPSDGTT